MERRMKYSLIEDEAARKVLFYERKREIIKKLSELSTLCGVKTCGVIYSPYNPELEAWPSREGAEGVITEFMEVPVAKRTERMVSQEAFLRERIASVQLQLQKLRAENRDFQIQNIMFGCLRGEIDMSNLGELDNQDLTSFIDKCIDKLICRAKHLRENGESSSPLSLLPPSRPLVVPDLDVVQVGDNDRENEIQNHQNLIQRQYDFLIEYYEDEDVPSMEGSHPPTYN
ncbi:MADS-box transcription factor PHERES 2 isoform X1 [Capsella rubella]|uniref:MADS-box transcription factor PHERES 2 isoform X1 n=1 Tax=Capsella rubella TaxID=81985 RepID=UPI000CD56AA8|nr:MADS-box transcription factor PHERES 2 isoform X1 [Capsella rubella]